MNDQERKAYTAMIAAGMMPQDAEDALRDAAARNQELPTDADIAEDAEVTESDLERLRLWFLWNPLVPTAFKRILTATVRHGAD